MHLIMVADFGVLRYRSGSLHNANSLIVISERNTVRNNPKGGTQKHSLITDLHFSLLTPYFHYLICHPEWHLHTSLKSSSGTVKIGSHHAHDSTLFVELGKEDVTVIWCGLLRNDDFNRLYVCFCHLQFRRCKWANWALGLQNALHYSVSKGVIQ